MSEPNLPTADFAFGQQYRVVMDGQQERYFVESADGLAVASLPVPLGGDVFTRTDHWFFTTVRRKIGWALVAQAATDKSEIADIREGLLPETYKLTISPDLELHVAQNPLSRNLTISQGRQHLARISDGQQLLRAGRSTRQRRVYAGEVTTLEPPRTPVALALPILLTLEMIKADAESSGIGDGGASLIY